MKTISIRGKKYTIVDSPRKDKQLLVKELGIHFGDPTMREYPGTKRGDAYCTRSHGIVDSQGNPTRNNIRSPNFWSRVVLWRCQGKKSLK